MNCKPGDLAYVIGSDWKQNVGALVNVRDSIRCDPGEWRCEAISPMIGERSSDHRMQRAHRGDSVFIDDKDLRPIRDPGDDAVDETLAWLPSPVELAQGAL